MDNDTTQITENATDTPQEGAGIQAGENAADTSEPQVGGETLRPGEYVPVDVEPEGDFRSRNAEDDARQADPVIRAWVRQNLSWLMAEIDHGRQGKTAEERTGLNP